LILNGLEEFKWTRRSFLIGTDASLELLPVQDARQYLIRLLHIYWAGLRRPLHFFPESSYVYARELLVNQREEQRALQAARAAWEGTPHSRGERDEEHYNLCFRTIDPIDEEFQQLSLQIFQPLMEHER